jgi:hypothetical protein
VISEIQSRSLDQQQQKGVRQMVARWFLFNTKVGELLLTFLERKVGLAVVRADWLGGQPSGQPTRMTETQ